MVTNPCVERLLFRSVSASITVPSRSTEGPASRDWPAEPPGANAAGDIRRVPARRVPAGLRPGSARQIIHDFGRSANSPHFPFPDSIDWRARSGNRWLWRRGGSDMIERSTSGQIESLFERRYSPMRNSCKGAGHRQCRPTAPLPGVAPRDGQAADRAPQYAGRATACGQRQAAREERGTDWRPEGCALREPIPCVIPRSAGRQPGFRTGLTHPVVRALTGDLHVVDVAFFGEFSHILLNHFGGLHLLGIYFFTSAAAWAHSSATFLSPRRRSTEQCFCISGHHSFSSAARIGSRCSSFFCK